MKPPTNLRGYTLERPLGKGGMGTVWVARKLTTSQPFAVKFLKEEFLEDATYLARFEREVQALRSIRHPNVVNVFEWSLPKDDPEAKPYVVMELLEGEGLDRLLRRQRILQPQLAVVIMLQILDGLAAAHNVGVIHRDLGPSNVFLTPQPNGTYLVRVLDFGLARPVTADEDAQQVTQMGTLMGKPGYVAPETFTHKSVDGRIDIFACGMMMYRMVAGRLPYKEMQAQYLWAERYAEKTHTNEYAPIREMAEWVPEKLGLVITKAIRRSPDERYLTCEDMQVDLLDIEDSTLARAAAVMPVPAPGSTETTSAATPESIDIVVQRTRERKRWMVVGGAAAAAVLLAGVLLVWSFGGSSGDVAAPDAAMGGSPVADAFVASASDAPSPEVPPPAADVAPAAPDAAGPTIAVAPPDAGAAAAEAVPEARTVLVVVAGAPEGATIKVGEYVAESDPPKVRVPYSEELLTVTVEAKGFEKFEEVILPTSDRVVNVRMRPIRRPPPRRDGGTGGTGPSFPEFPEGP